MKRALPWILLAVFTCSASSFAQDDDDLAPLAPRKPKPAPAKPKPKPAPKPPVAKPKVEDDDLAPIAVSKGDVSIKFPQALSNATVNIDGKDVGTIPLPNQSLPVGEHTIKIRRAGYAEFVKKVTVSSGKVVEVEARLNATHALLSVTSDVPDAQVLINGVSKGTAPIKDLEVLPGAVEIVVRKDGYKDDKRKVALVAGKEYPVTVSFSAGSTTVIAANDRPVETKLTPPPEDPTPLDTGVTKPVEATPIYERWYFWAGVAAVAAAATIGTAVAVNNSQPQQRLDEKTVCAVNGGRCDICVGFQCAATFLKF